MSKGSSRDNSRIPQIVFRENSLFVQIPTIRNVNQRMSKFENHIGNFSVTGRGLSQKRKPSLLLS